MGVCADLGLGPDNEREHSTAGNRYEHYRCHRHRRPALQPSHEPSLGTNIQVVADQIDEEGVKPSLMVRYERVR